MPGPSTAPAAIAAPAAPHPDAPTTRRGFWRAARGIVAFSLAVTMAAALVAMLVAGAGGTRFTLAFVILRWCLVGALLVTPLVHQASMRFGATWRLPWALRTPATALLLTCESIGFDIASARLGE